MSLEVFNYNCPGQLSFIAPDFIKDADYTVRTPVIRGVKDSTACYYKLLELGVPKEKIEL